MEKAGKSCRGFTLIELMIAITILSIIISVATPPMSNLVKRYRAEIQRQHLFELIALARGKAYSEGAIYTLCGSADGQTCTRDWSKSALLFRDADGSGSRDSDEKIERIMEALPEGSSLNWRSWGNKSYLQYRPSGLTLSQSGNFSYCPPDGDNEFSWIIVLNGAGRPYYGRDTNGDGMVENGSGEDLDCRDNG
ncbi:hypothetical protein Maes01_01618 [Microbulbifer aestuariivivens]|uniref:Type II secretion system protein H n=1 Tax=Microbulbifer aestuariivivens TaxID=1908308 RepID=A0ABP9WR57_9GAMM